MLNLNDDCLNEIFVKLDLKDQLNLTRVCHRFQENVVENLFQKQFCEFNTTNPLLTKLNQSDVIFLLQLISINIKSLRIVQEHRYEPGRYIHYISGPELKSYFTLNLSNLQEFEGVTTYVTEPSQQLTDQHILLLTDNCRNLRKLRVESKRITGEHISKFNHLEELTMEECSLKEESLIEILTQLHLKFLKLIHVRANIEKILLDAPIPATLQTLIVSDVKVFGMLLVENLNVKNLHFDTREPQRHDLSIAGIKAIREATTFPRIRNSLRSLRVGFVLDFLGYLRDFLAPEHEQRHDDTFPNYVEILSELLKIIDYCKKLECLEITSLVLDTNKLDQFVTLFLLRQRPFRLLFQTTESESSLLQKWLRESQVYNSQTLLTVELLSPPGDEHIVKYGF